MAPQLQRTPVTGDIPKSNYYMYSFSLLAAFFVASYIVKNLRSPLRSVPGPFSTRLTRFTEICAIYKTNYAQWSIDMHQKYSPIVRLAPNRYSVADADAAKILLGHKSGLNKSRFYDAFGTPKTVNLFSVKEISVHAAMRRPLAHLYSQSSLMAYEPAIDACNRIRMKRLRAYASESKTLDIRNLMQYYAFDVIGEITVGSRFGLMEDDGDKNGITDAIVDTLYYGAYAGLWPSLHPLIIKTSELLRFEPGFQKLSNFIDNHLHARLLSETKSPDGRADFLDKMLPMEVEGKVTRRDTRTACVQNIGAGSDTTAISLTAVIGYLALYPRALAALRQEIDGAAADGTLSTPATFQEAQRLPYLQAVTNEALRLHPAVGFPLMRVIGPAGAELAGQYFPPGTEVGINPWVLHNDKSIFGTDASDFRPERWLDATPEGRGRLDRNMIAFGSGPRTCVGKNISLLEMYKAVPQIVRAFDFEIVPDEDTGKPWTSSTAWFVWQDLKCKVRDRR